MALGFSHGSFRWLAIDALSTVYTISGLSFAPKAIRIYWMGTSSTTDAATQSLSLQRGIGFASSTSSRRCVGTFSADAAGSADTACIAASDCVAIHIDGTGAVVGKVDVNSFTSDGFTLIVDDATTVSTTIFWEAWGGDDITTVTIGDIAEPAATGTQNYTATGFTTAGTDQVVMLAGIQSTAAVGTGQANDSGFYVGFSTGSTTAQNIVVVGNSDDGSATMDTDGYGRAGECVAMITVAGGNPSARAVVSAWGTDLFTLNWTNRATTSRRSIYMAIKGGSWQAGSYTIAGNSLNATATVSGLSFSPAGISLMGRMAAEDAAGTATAQDRISLGSGSSTSSRRSMGCWDEDATANAEIDLCIEYDSVLCFPSNAGVIAATYDINAMNSDGFQIIVDTAGGVASEWQGYLAFGSTAITGTLATTTGAATTAITSAETFSGTAATTTGTATANFTGSIPIPVTGTLGTTTASATASITTLETFTGTAASTAGSATASFASAETFSGTLATTGANATASIAALETFTGTASATTSNATAAISAAETFAGTLATAQESATASFAGSVVSPVTGTLATTADNFTVAVTALETFTGSAAASTSSATAAISVQETFSGTAAATSANATTSIAALETFSGTVSSTTGNTTGAFAASLTFQGTVSTATTSATAAIASLETFTGASASTADSFTAAFAATQGSGATLAATIDSATASIAALETFSGSLASSTASATAAMEAIETFAGSAAFTTASATASFAALETFAASVGTTINAATADFSGSNTPAAGGGITAVIANASASISATLELTGTVATTVGSATATVTAAETHTGTVSSTAGNATASATAAQSFIATVSATTDAAVATLQAVLSNVGNIATSTSAATASIEAVILGDNDGNIAATVSNATASASGENVPALALQYTTTDAPIHVSKRPPFHYGAVVVQLHFTARDRLHYTAEASSEDNG